MTNSRTGAAFGRQKAMLLNRDGSTAFAIRSVACSVPPTEGNGRMCAIRLRCGLVTRSATMALLTTKSDKGCERVDGAGKRGSCFEIAAEGNLQARPVREWRLDEGEVVRVTQCDG